MKILIADDEDYSREGLIESIDWEEFGIDEIMQAVNGQEALKIAKWFRPDIVLTDIRMPKMDGIDFASALLENNKDSKIIFISGYMEIEYLKSAIRLSVVDYIEKPVDINVLREAISKAVKGIRDKRESREAKENQRDIKFQTLVSLLCSKEADTMTVEKLAREADFPLNTSYVCMILWMPKGSHDENGDMKKLLDVLQSRKGKAMGRYDREKKQFQMILSFQKKEEYHLRPICTELLEAFPQTKLGMGIEVEDYKYVYNSYRTALAAVNDAFYQQDKRFFQIDERIRQRKTIEPGVYGEFLQILSQQPHSLKEWFRTLFEELYKSRYYGKEQVYTLLISLLTALYRQYPEIYNQYPEICSEEQLQAVLYDKESLKEIEDFLNRILTYIQESGEEKAGYSRVIAGVLDYVSKHYMEENLSVVQVAEHLHFSPAYLNVLFKQEMKITVKQYLSNYRLERAKNMLERGYEKVNEIAEKCGYANGNYFAKVFREATGMTPAEYRKKTE